MPLEERLHPVLARHYPPERVDGSPAFRDVVVWAFDGLGRTGELLDLVELIDSSMTDRWQNPDSKNFADKSCGATLDEILTGAKNANFVSTQVVLSFMFVIQRHNGKQQSVPPPPMGFNTDENHWQKIEQLAISNLRSNDRYTWLQIIAEIPGPREKCVNAINAIVNLNQFSTISMRVLCKAIVNHCESNAHVLLEYLLSTSEVLEDDNDCAKALAKIGYWRHITLFQEAGANGLAEELRFRLIANGSSYIESIHNIEFNEEEINREIMALKNEELRAEKMQQTSLQAQLTGHIRALSSRVESLEKKKEEESSPQTVVNIMNLDLRDSVVMGNIEQSTKKDSMFDLDDLDL